MKRDIDELRSRMDDVWDRVPVAQDRTTLIEEFIREVFGSRSIVLARAAMSVTLIRVDQIRRSAFSDGGRAPQALAGSLPADDLARSIGAAIAPRAQVFGEAFDESNMVQTVARILAAGARGGMTDIGTYDDDFELISALLLSLTVNLDDWEEIYSMHSSRDVRRRLARASEMFNSLAGD
ncbi:hypothetical protein MYK68_03665 [Gordonia sp. PP30]|uniref:hypothetical protein n=1 Tax=Gordonia sp. PP30 TaxID=2935861 RepID=UPI002000376C|nr:hypothetical protein [Gordonia sp. PP30]UQE75727.1 hypothetical protein MYK68_03665 [Gordonia sp. PP30]